MLFDIAPELKGGGESKKHQASIPETLGHSPTGCRIPEQAAVVPGRTSIVFRQT